MRKSTNRAARGRKKQPESMEQTLGVGLRKAVPVMFAEISDMFEKQPPRLTKRTKREMEKGIDAT